jgi:predicted SnoaL-like aldol condensation-catalyzing enzyme
MQTVAEGNFVLAASEGMFGGKPAAFLDLFRVDNGKTAEHWDVMADVPAKMAHGNGKF